MENIPEGATHFIYNVNKIVFLKHVRDNRYNHVLNTGRFGDLPFKTFGKIKPITELK